MTSYSLEKNGNFNKLLINKLNSKQIKADTITADTITADTITTNNISVNTINNISVNTINKKDKKEEWLYSIEINNAKLNIENNYGTLKFLQDDIQNVIQFSNRPNRIQKNLNSNVIRSYYIFNNKLFDDSSGNPNGIINFIDTNNHNKVICCEFEIIVKTNIYICSLQPLNNQNIPNINNFNGKITVFLDNSSNPYQKFWDTVFNDIIDTLKSFVIEIIDDVINTIEDLVEAVGDLIIGNFEGFLENIGKATYETLDLIGNLADPEFSLALDAISSLKTSSGKPVFPSSFVYFLGALKGVHDAARKNNIPKNIKRDELSFQAGKASNLSDKTLANNISFIKNYIKKSNDKIKKSLNNDVITKLTAIQSTMKFILTIFDPTFTSESPIE